VYSSYFHPNR